jgi:hypothetical protein
LLQPTDGRFGLAAAVTCCYLQLQAARGTVDAHPNVDTSTQLHPAIRVPTLLLLLTAFAPG